MQLLQGGQGRTQLGGGGQRRVEQQPWRSCSAVSRISTAM